MQNNIQIHRVHSIPFNSNALHCHISWTCLTPKETAEVHTWLAGFTWASAKADSTTACLGSMAAASEGLWFWFEWGQPASDLQTSSKSSVNWGLHHCLWLDHWTTELQELVTAETPRIPKSPTSRWLRAAVKVRWAKSSWSCAHLGSKQILPGTRNSPSVRRLVRRAVARGAFLPHPAGWLGINFFQVFIYIPSTSLFWCWPGYTVYSYPFWLTPCAIVVGWTPSSRWYWSPLS